MLHSAGYYELLRGFVSFFIPLLWLQVGIFMGDVLDAGARLLGVQVVVPYDHGAVGQGTAFYGKFQTYYVI